MNKVCTILMLTSFLLQYAQENFEKKNISTIFSDQIEKYYSQNGLEKREFHENLSNIILDYLTPFQKILELPLNVVYVSWSNDNSKLAIVTHNEFMIIDVNKLSCPSVCNNTGMYGTSKHMRLYFKGKFFDKGFFIEGLNYRNIDEYNITRDHDRQTPLIKWFDDDKFLAVCKFDFVKIFDTQTGQLINEYSFPSYVSDFSISTNNLAVAYGNNIDIYNLNSARLIKKIKEKFKNKEKYQIKKVEFSNNNKMIAYVLFNEYDAGTRIKIKNLQTYKTIRKFISTDNRRVREYFTYYSIPRIYWSLNDLDLYFQHEYRRLCINKFSLLTNELSTRMSGLIIFNQEHGVIRPANISYGASSCGQYRLTDGGAIMDYKNERYYSLGEDINFHCSIWSADSSRFVIIDKNSKIHIYEKIYE